MPSPALKLMILREQRLRLIVFMSLLCALCFLLFAVENLLLTTLIAVVVTYLFKPLVNAAERAGLKRTGAILFLFITLGALLGFSINWVAPKLAEQLSSLQTEFPKYRLGLTELLSTSEQKVSQYFVDYEIRVSDRLGSFLQSKLTDTLEELPRLASRIFTVALLAPFFCFFLLRDGRQFSRQIISIVPNHFFEMALNLTHQINEQIGGFIRARLIEALIVGVIVWLGLAVIDFPYSLFLAVFAAVTNLIPYVGPIVGAVPAFAISFINKDPSLTVLLMGSVYMIAQVVDIFLIIPAVVARIVNLHPISVVVAIIIGSQLMGVIGMIISIPIASALKLTAVTLYDNLIRFKIN